MVLAAIVDTFSNSQFSVMIITKSSYCLIIDLDIKPF